jgi:murein DD-endopeptidase MepM/ murein hydrolase activator NlpD
VPKLEEIRIAARCELVNGTRKTMRGRQGPDMTMTPGTSASVRDRMARKPFAFLAGAACMATLVLVSPSAAQQLPAPTTPAPGTDVSQPPAGSVPMPSTTPVPTPAPAAPATPAAPAAPGQVLRPGSRGASVKKLQRALRARGIKVPVDGAYGARTRAGVRILQRRMKVRATGIADAAVLKRLRITVRTVATGPPVVLGTPFDSYPVPEPNDTTPSPTGFVWPANGVVSSPFGPRWGRMHEGIDIAAPEGRPIRAAKAGVVTTAEAQSGYGNLIVLDHGNGETTRYGHMSAFTVAKGQAVAIGQQIGLVGNTGRSTGPHLHFEIRIGGTAMDPRPYL